MKKLILKLLFYKILTIALLIFYSGTVKMDNRQTWPEMYKSALSQMEYELLVRAKETLLNNILLPGQKQVPWYPLRGIAPSNYYYFGVWPWDASFHAVGVSRWDPILAREQLQIILDNQQESGAFFNCYDIWGNILREPGQPPVYPWATMIVDQRNPDTAFLKMAYRKFIRYEEHWMRDRGGKEEGLFHYGGPEPFWESGWDNAVRWDYPPGQFNKGHKEGCESLWAIDLNCYMYMMYQSLAYMAMKLSIVEDEEHWLKCAGNLAKAINEQLFDETSGYYVDRYRKTNTFSTVITPASFMPLYIRIAPKDRATKMAKLAADPNKFFPGMPSVAYDNPVFGSNEYWRGPTWINISYFALKGLKNYGYDKTADACRDTILQWCDKNNNYLYEYYDSRSGKGIGAKQYGWSATFVIEFILNWDTKNTF
jgi:putative isomerase